MCHNFGNGQKSLTYSEDASLQQARDVITSVRSPLAHLLTLIVVIKSSTQGERWNVGELRLFGRLMDGGRRQSRRCDGNGGWGLAIRGPETAAAVGGGRQGPEVVLSDALI